MMENFQQKSNESKKARILVVDDDPMVLEIFQKILTEHGYIFQGASSGETALKMIEEDPPDIVLLDIKMPGMTGFEVLERIKNNDSLGFIPVIMLTALENEQAHAFKMGADDFIAKPPALSELFARINAQLRLKNYIEELSRAEEVLFTLATIIEVKDKYTEDHTERVAAVALKMGEALGLSKKEMDDLRKGALLHDIGKVGIPDRILQKKEPLTPEEWEKLKEHVIIGERICSSLKSLRGALPIIRHHHERWDGTGYPDGLKGFDIPFLARIVALADSYDAMRFDRPYRPKLEKDKILEVLEEGAGKQWDPSLTRLLIDLIKRGEV